MPRDRASLAVVVAIAVLVEPGCTLVGLGAGIAADHGGPPPNSSLPSGELGVLAVGSGIQLQLRDGTRIGGRYRGLDWTRPPDYASRYEAAILEIGPEPPLPALGRGARVALKNGRQVHGELLGFGPGFVSVGTKPGKQTVVPLREVQSITDGARHSASLQDLRSVIGERRVPLVPGLKIDVAGEGSRVVPYDDVVEVILVARTHRGRNTGLILGAVADVTVVALAAYAMSQPWQSSGTTTSTSCPLFDSFDGREFVLDAEPLGGAIHRAAERTDLVRLDRVVSHDGEYLLRLRNDQQEIDHVDAVALRVVDHAPGSEVVPSGDGHVHVVLRPAAPSRARVLATSRLDRSDFPLAALLASADGETWASDVRGRDPGRPEELRDGVEIEFPRPAAVDSAVLLLRAGGTALAPRVLRVALGLHGRALSGFYGRLSADPSARAAFEQTWEREVLPTVRVREASGWRVVGHVRDLPSLVPRDQALPVDLRGTEGPTVRVRIDGPPGLWSLDRVVLAVEDEPAATERRVGLSAAVTDDGRDVAGVLSSADRRRHLLRPGRDAAVLHFPAPPLRPGWERTVLLEVTGYYSAIVPAEGDPQPAAFRRLTDEPGGVARFTLEWLRAGGRI